jgi:predicted  nucleic acid-binding Zn-ribbon protein
MTDEIVPPADPAEEIERLRERIADLENELREAKAAAAAEVQTEITGLRAQLAALVNPPAAKGKRLDGFFEVDDE